MRLPYVLGIDVGSSHTTAALHRHGGDTAAVLPLDEGRPWVDSALYLAADDTVLIGRDALARAETEPERVVRGFACRVGDPVAPLVGGRPCPAEMLLAALVRWVVDRATDRERDAPERIVVTHAASWGPHRRVALDHALRQVDLPDVLQLPKPIAAAESYAGTHEVPAGAAVAVYDLGDQSLCCAVTRLGRAGFALASRVDTDEPGAGRAFDDLLVGHVLAELGRVPADLDPYDEDLRPAMAQLRSACRAAKETLSAAPEAVIPTPMLGPPSSVLIGRARFEELIGRVADRTVDLLRLAVRAARTPRLAAVTLVGGSARIPLIAELVKAAVPARVVLDPDPETAVARGAALAGNRVTVPEVQVPVRLPEQRDEDEGVEVDAPTQPPRPPVDVIPIELPRRGTRRWKATSRARRRTD
jgi:molecular chaperone DnaK (HSP70)